jgi:hypothetical protein
MSADLPLTYSGLTDRCREALLAAAADPDGFLPQATSGAVLGRLYRLGLAERQAITEAGLAWVAAHRFPTGGDAR